MWTQKARAEDAAKGALAGMVGGVVGSLTMELFQSGLKKFAGSGGEGEPSTVKAAEILSENVRDQPLAEDEKKTGGELVHYAFGALSGAVYGMSAEALPKASAGWGALFGGVLWLLGDEIGVPAAGLGKSPDETPISQHASAFAAHLVYGVTTDLVRRGVLTVLG